MCQFLVSMGVTFPFGESANCQLRCLGSSTCTVDGCKILLGTVQKPSVSEDSPNTVANLMVSTMDSKVVRTDFVHPQYLHCDQVLVKGTSF